MYTPGTIANSQTELCASHFAFCEAIFKSVKKCEVYILYFLKNPKHKVCLKRFNFHLRLFTFVNGAIQIVNQLTRNISRACNHTP